MRDPIQPITYLLINEKVLDNFLKVVKNLPIDSEKPLEIVIREKTKVRSKDQNARLWASAMNDIAKQAWVEGRQYDTDIWHYYLKCEYLPDENLMTSEELAKHVAKPDKWQKWQYLPSGERVLKGSTTKLTPPGFAQYMEKVYAYGASLGVMFGMKESD